MYLSFDIKYLTKRCLFHLSINAYTYAYSRMQVLTGTAPFVIFSSNIHPNFIDINYPAATGSLLQLLNLIGMDQMR